jgi:putative addiction module component (TIGR02574 family)
LPQNDGPLLTTRSGPFLHSERGYSPWQPCQHRVFCAAWRETLLSPEKSKDGESGIFPIAFAYVVSYARCMENLTHDELVRLTPPERLTLISQLWDSLEDTHLPLTAAQRGELDRRLATLDEDRREGVTWGL